MWETGALSRAAVQRPSAEALSRAGGSDAIGGIGGPFDREVSGSAVEPSSPGEPASVLTRKHKEGGLYGMKREEFVPGRPMQRILSKSRQIESLYAVGSEVIGQGGFGQVRRATLLSSGKDFAVKIIRQEIIESVSHFQKEVDITMAMEHPYIVKSFETFEDSCNVYFVMELCSGGELFERIIENQRLTEPQGAAIMHQACHAIAYMHGQQVVHRDLKPENFLFESPGPVDSTPLKLIDFGLARRFEPGEVMKSAVGTPSYVAPEVLRGAHGPACDLWSCGVLLYISLCGCVPFDADNPKDILKRVKKGAYSLNHRHWDGVSEDAKSVVRGLLEKNQTLRMTAAQVLKHPWMESALPADLRRKNAVA